MLDSTDVWREVRNWTPGRATHDVNFWIVMNPTSSSQPCALASREPQAPAAAEPEPALLRIPPRHPGLTTSGVRAVLSAMDGAVPEWIQGSDMAQINSQLSSYVPNLGGDVIRGTSDGRFAPGVRLLAASRPFLQEHAALEWGADVTLGAANPIDILQFVNSARSTPGDTRKVYYAGGDTAHASLIIFVREGDREAVVLVDSTSPEQYSWLNAVKDLMQGAGLHVYQQAGFVQRDRTSCRAYAWEAARALCGRHREGKPGKFGPWLMPGLLARLDAHKTTAQAPGDDHEPRERPGLTQFTPLPELARFSQDESWLNLYAANELDVVLCDSGAPKTLGDDKAESRYSVPGARFPMMDRLRQSGWLLLRLAEIAAIGKRLQQRAGNDWDAARQRTLAAHLQVQAELKSRRGASDIESLLALAHRPREFSSETLLLLEKPNLELRLLKRATVGGQSAHIENSMQVAQNFLNEVQHAIAACNFEGSFDERLQAQSTLDDAIWKSRALLESIGSALKAERIRLQALQAGDEDLSRLGALAGEPDEFLREWEASIERWKSRLPNAEDIEAAATHAQLSQLDADLLRAFERLDELAYLASLVSSSPQVGERLPLQNAVAALKSVAQVLRSKQGQQQRLFTEESWPDIANAIAVTTAKPAQLDPGAFDLLDQAVEQMKADVALHQRRDLNAMFPRATGDACTSIPVLQGGVQRHHPDAAPPDDRWLRTSADRRMPRYPV